VLRSAVLRAVCAAVVSGAASLKCGAAAAQEPPASVARESLDEAWWTGPLLAANASTLPQGHLYLEPYLYDSLPYAQFDSSGHGHRVTHEDDLGSLTYVNYGLTDRITVGMLPRFGYDDVPGGTSSSGLGIGDLTLQGQYRLTQFHPGDWIPTIAFNLQETVPTGRYDRLDQASDGFGAGAYTTTASVYSQTYLWMPNGRILRARLNVSYAASSHVSVEDASVYGTVAGFRGRVVPGSSAYGDLAFEYSVTDSWVAATDLWYERDAATRVTGSYPQAPDGTSSPVAVTLGPGRELIVAPALEYNWSARLGVIFGVRLVATGRNETGIVTPVAAISYFR